MLLPLVLVQLHETSVAHEENNIKRALRWHREVDGAIELDFDALTDPEGPRLLVHELEHRDQVHSDAVAHRGLVGYQTVTAHEKAQLHQHCEVNVTHVPDPAEYNLAKGRVIELPRSLPLLYEIQFQVH